MFPSKARPYVRTQFERRHRRSSAVSPFRLHLQHDHPVACCFFTAPAYVWCHTVVVEGLPPRKSRVPRCELGNLPVKDPFFVLHPFFFSFFARLRTHDPVGVHAAFSKHTHFFSFLSLFTTSRVCPPAPTRYLPILQSTATDLT